MSQHSLHSFFWPKSIAVLGASPDASRIRGRLLHQLRENGFVGRILPINPSYHEIDGLPCYASIAAVGEAVDLALVAIPAASVAQALEECADAGVKNALIVSSGFAEEGGAASDLQAALIDVTKRTGIRACGPNCEGYFNALGKIATTFSPTVEVRLGDDRLLVSDGCAGVIAQSGGIGFALYNRGSASGIGFSYVISTGNEADLNMADFLDYMIEDANTNVVILFCEVVRDGAAFTAALAKARRLGKPIIAIKVGRSAAGIRASASHTASLSGSYAAYRAVFAHYGVIEAEDPDEAVAITGVLLTCPLPKGRRAGIITPSGGGGVWMADTLSVHGLTVPRLSPVTQAALRSVMPSYGAPGNPVDVTAQGSNTAPAVMSAMETLASSDEIDMLVLITSLTSETRVSLDAERVRATAARCGKPMTVWTYTLPSEFGRRTAAGCGLFVHSDLRNVGIAMGRLADFAEAQAIPLPAPPVSLPPTPLPRDLPNVLTEQHAKSLLVPYGLPALRERLVTSATQAAEAASALGFPVALKIASPDLPHKTEAGGVILGLQEQRAVAAAYEQIIASVQRYKGDARIEGVLVQKMAPRGHELVVGMVNDPTFGPIMMVGLGGTVVELMADVVHRPAPVDAVQAIEMLRSLRAAKLLEGFRGAAPIDLGPVAELIANLSRAALAHRERIAEMELNPVIVHADGSGFTIADALIRLRD
jgi:acyl-CoA synthetase (NDP forming)